MCSVLLSSNVHSRRKPWNVMNFLGSSLRLCSSSRHNGHHIRINLRGHFHVRILLVITSDIPLSKGEVVVSWLYVIQSRSGTLTSAVGVKFRFEHETENLISCVSHAARNTSDRVASTPYRLGSCDQVQHTTREQCRALGCYPRLAHILHPELQ